MAIPTAPESIANHWDILWYAFCALLIGGIGDTLRRLGNIERKQDAQKDVHANCKNELLDKLVSKKEFGEWKSGRDILWKRVNHHDHKDGKVVILDE